jgi:hypothetical protein
MRDVLVSNVVIIVCVSPSMTCSAETYSSLQFCELAKHAVVDVSPAKRVATPDQTELREALQQERTRVADLQDKILGRDAEVLRLRAENEALVAECRETKKVRFLSDLNPEFLEYDNHNERYNDDRIFDHISIFSDSKKWPDSDSPHADTNRSDDFSSADIISKYWETYSHVFGGSQSEND